jgi:hypothetical protein
MTATPIPRTLAMAAYADLDTSVIDELPPGRRPVATIAVPDSRRGEIVGRVRSACAEGQQAYWVCPLIEESEVLDYQAAEASYQMLSEALPELRIGLVHGRMRPAEKENGMRAFKDGLIQLLVATTVIEVGVDVPNASLMIIENAERMGLSQLHQLRGRVGRGAAQSLRSCGTPMMAFSSRNATWNCADRENCWAPVKPVYRTTALLTWFAMLTSCRKCKSLRRPYKKHPGREPPKSSAVGWATRDDTARCRSAPQRATNT